MSSAENRYLSSSTTITFQHSIITSSHPKSSIDSSQLNNMFSKTIILALFASSAAFAASIQQRQLNPSVQLCSNKDFNDCDNVNFHYGICGKSFSACISVERGS